MSLNYAEESLQDYMIVTRGIITGKVSIMRGNILRYECLCGNDDITFLPVANWRQNIETRHPSSILGDSMDLETNGPETSHSHSTESHLVDYEENEVVLPELVIPGAGPSRVTLPELKDELSPHLSDEETRSVIKVEQIVDKMVDPLSCGRNNNPLLPDGFDQDVSGGAIETDTIYDDNDVKIISSLPPKKSRIGQKSPCPANKTPYSREPRPRLAKLRRLPLNDEQKLKRNEGENKLDTSSSSSEKARKFTCAGCGVVFKSRDLIQLHVSKCPEVKSKLLLHEKYNSKASSMPKSVKIKCEFCGKGLAKTSLTKHIMEIHLGKRKQCRVPVV